MPIQIPLFLNKVSGFLENNDWCKSTNDDNVHPDRQNSFPSLTELQLEVLPFGPFPCFFDQQVTCLPRRSIMETIYEELTPNGRGEIRHKKDDIDLRELLFSPIKDVASWLNLPDKQMPCLEEVSPRSPVDVDMTPSTSTMSDASIDEDVAVPATPKAIASPKDDNFDPFREIVNFFSPRPKLVESSKQDEEYNATLRVRNASITPRGEEQPKRLDFEGVAETAPPAESSCTMPTREVATIRDLYIDTRHGLKQIVATAKEFDVREWLDKARQLETKDLAQKTKCSTRRIAKKVENQMTKIVESAKEVEPKVVFENAKTSAKELVETVQSNAKVHPLPWTVIGVVALTILVHVIFFSGAVGTPAMRFWRFTIKMHSSAQGTASNIVERVGSFLLTEMGEDAKQIFESTKSAASYAAVSGQDILMRLSQSLVEPAHLDADIVDVVVDQLALIRENPRQYLKMVSFSSQTLVADIWKRGHQLTTDAFDDVTAL